MMKRAVAGLMLCMLIAVPSAWGLDLMPGKYEITSKVEMPGMPGAMPPQTVVQCLDQQDPVPNAAAGSQGCEITDMKTKGNTVTYTMECGQQGAKMKSTGRITFNGDTFEGSTQTVMGPEAGGMTITTVIMGKRIGACK